MLKINEKESTTRHNLNKLTMLSIYEQSTHVVLWTGDTQFQRNHNINIMETFHFRFYILICNNKQLNSNPDPPAKQNTRWESMASYQLTAATRGMRPWGSSCKWREGNFNRDGENICYNLWCRSTVTCRQRNFANFKTLKMFPITIPF